MILSNRLYETASFAYYELADNFPTALISEDNEFYIMRPHACMQLLVKKTDPQNSGYGIYIASDIQRMITIFSTLKSCRIVHNFYKEREPWLFMEEEADGFRDDLDKLICLIKTLKKKN